MGVVVLGRDWSFWGVLPPALMLLVLCAYLVQLAVERHRGRSSDATSGGLWTAAGLALMLFAWTVPVGSPWRWLLLVAWILTMLAGWLRGRTRNAAPPEASP